MNHAFKGLGVAMVTPFKEDKTVDFKALERLISHLISKGADYLVVQGTTGESATLSVEEKKAVLEYVKEINNGKLPIVLGVGGNHTQSVLNQIETFDLTLVDGLLSVSPYYNKPTQEGIYQHYATIASATPLPIILYNVPGRTASNVLAKTTLRLAQNHKNIIAVKEASGDLEQIMEIIAEKPDGFEVISGDDAITFPIVALGGIGVISVVANAFPGDFSKLIQATANGELENARMLQYKLLKIIQALFADGNPGGIKEVLQMLGICENHMRLPLVPVSESTRSRLRELAEAAGYLKSVGQA